MKYIPKGIGAKRRNKMKNEAKTEAIIRTNMGFEGNTDNEFIKVYPQASGNTGIANIDVALKTAGGKPSTESHKVFNVNTGNGSATPEYVITFKNDENTILVIEAKADITKHVSGEKMDQPKDYAIDGLLFYMKHLSRYFNVIGVAVSGTEENLMKVDHYYWAKNHLEPTDLDIKFPHLLNSFIEPMVYMEILGEELKKYAYSEEEALKVAKLLNKQLATKGVSILERATVVSGCLIALTDNRFCSTYKTYVDSDDIINGITNAIDRKLNDSGLDTNRIAIVKNNIAMALGQNVKFNIGLLGDYSSNENLFKKKQLNLRDIVCILEEKILYMVDGDALGLFYHEFLQYASGDGKELGIILTPQHICDLMVDMIDVNHNDVICDPTAGTGSFLVAGFSKMTKGQPDNVVQDIRANGIYGTELQPSNYLSAVTNLILRGDGKSNIFNDDCFSPIIDEKFKAGKITKGLMNPPFIKDIEGGELAFVNTMLNRMASVNEKTGDRSKLAVIIPISCAINSKNMKMRETIMMNHTLEAVYTMPSDLFMPNAAVSTCIMIWTPHVPHNSDKKTFLAKMSDDGFGTGSTRKMNKTAEWANIRNEWLEMNLNKEIIEGVSTFEKLDYSKTWLPDSYLHQEVAINEKMFVKTMLDRLLFEKKQELINNN